MGQAWNHLQELKSCCRKVSSGGIVVGKGMEWKKKVSEKEKRESFSFDEPPGSPCLGMILEG